MTEVCLHLSDAFQIFKTGEPVIFFLNVNWYFQVYLTIFDAFANEIYFNIKIFYESLQFELK